MTTWLLLAAAILAEVTATLSLRGALDLPALYVVVVVGYVLTFALLTQVLRRGMGLGVAYGLWGAIGVVLTAGASAVLFGESLGALKISGILLIAAGVAVVELGSQRARRAEAAAADAGAGERPHGGPGPVPVAAADTAEPPGEEWLAGATSYGSRGEVELLRELEVHAIPGGSEDGREDEREGAEAR
ncbi:DMT family transporter [Brachybacterium paraconglomeratum]|uniref:DMT family transporter n=1 Tax=Brachybacterium paraconglomeratum TaxID=173362 RepID=UPI00387A0DE7